MIAITALSPLLLKQHYAVFWISILALAFLFVWLQQVVFNDLICNYFNIDSWKKNVHFLHTWMDILIQFSLALLVVLGIFIGRMFKYWNKEQEHKQRIQASKLRMETETMKEQVSPSLLCSTLRFCGESAEAAPKETSETLMRLSRLLRYQLYDCRQEKVLLDSEIKFLKEYLSILQYNNNCNGFNLSVSGPTIGILIPPLLFVPLLQSEETPDKHTFIDINIHIHNDSLTFELNDNYTQRNDTNVRNRLEQLYPQKHNLTIKPRHVMLEIQIR
jgi:LytS/YehU family sensor histidine kinase